MSIELDIDSAAEVVRAQIEAREAVARARRLVERSRALLLDQAPPPDTATDLAPRPGQPG